MNLALNVVGVTQGSNLRVYLRLLELLGTRREIGRSGIYVADSMTVRAVLASEPPSTSADIEWLREWELFGAGRHRMPDWPRLAEIERELGDPVLWNALMADRRLFFGARCKIRQDYSPRFSHIQMGGILQCMIEGIEAFLARMRPNLIIGLGTATLGDYLFFRFAKARSIPYLHLKPTKIGNYIALNDDAIELSDHVARMLDGREPIPAMALETGARHREAVRDRGMRYEGAIAPRGRIRVGLGVIAMLRGLAVDLRRLRDPVTRHDNHPEWMLRNNYYEHFRNPLHALWLERRLRRHTVSAEALATLPPFAFFPLHFEPEVSLQVFGRPYQNQIELIRVLAANLPAGMPVVVKEHPRARGFRPLGYYRKLLEIPNVLLVDTQLRTNVVIQHASLVAVVSGSTGLEAAVAGKPVLTFGTPPYNVLEGAMIRHVRDLNTLAETVRELLDRFACEPERIERFFAATIAGSVPVDLYTTLLRKPGRLSEGREAMSVEERAVTDYVRLADYCMARIDAVLADAASATDAGKGR